MAKSRKRKQQMHTAQTHKRAAQTTARHKQAKRVPMIVNRAQARSNQQRRTFNLPVAVPKPRLLDISEWREKQRAA